MKFNRYHFFRIIKFPYESDIHEFWAAVLNELLSPNDPYESAEDWLSAGGEHGSHAAIIQRTVSDMRCTGSNRVRKTFFKELMLKRGWTGQCLFFKHGKCTLSAEQQVHWKMFGDTLTAGRWWNDSQLVFKLLQASNGPIPYNYLGTVTIITIVFF